MVSRISAASRSKSKEQRRSKVADRLGNGGPAGTSSPPRRESAGSLSHWGGEGKSSGAFGNATGQARVDQRYNPSYTGFVKTAISLPDPLFEAADQLAKRLGMSRSELYATAIEKYLRSHRNEEVTAALNRIYREEPSNLDPVIAAIQAASLPRDEW